MVKHSEVGILGAALRRSQGFSADSEVLVLSSRVRRAAPSLQIQCNELMVARYGLTETATLTMLAARSDPVRRMSSRDTCKRK